MRLLPLTCAFSLACTGRPSVLPPDHGPAPPIAEYSTWDMGGISALSLSANDTIAQRHAVAPTFDGQGTVVVWREIAHGERLPTYALAVADGDGSVRMRSTGITQLSAAFESDMLWVTETEDGYVFYYNDVEEIYSVWVDHTGVLRAETQIRDGYDYTEARMAGAGANHAVIYRRWVGPHYQVSVQRMRSTGVRRSSERSVDSSATANQYEPAAVWVGDGYLVVWRQSSAIHIARTDDTGVATGPAMILEASTDNQSWPNITGDDANHNLVTWNEDGRKRLLMVDNDGVPTWSSSQVVVSENRVESFSYSIAGGHGRTSMSWESDANSVYPQITFGTLAITAADLPPAQQTTLSDPTFPCFSPSTAIGANYTGVAFRCPTAGAWRLFITQVSR